MAGKEKDPKVQQPRFPMLLLTLRQAQQGIRASVLENTTQTLTSLFVLKHLQPYPKLFNSSCCPRWEKEQSCISQVPVLYSVYKIFQYLNLCNTHIYSFKSPLTHHFQQQSQIGSPSFQPSSPSCTREAACWVLWGRLISLTDRIVCFPAVVFISIFTYTYIYILTQPLNSFLIKQSQNKMHFTFLYYKHLSDTAEKLKHSD